MYILYIFLVFVVFLIFFFFSSLLKRHCLHYDRAPWLAELAEEGGGGVVLTAQSQFLDMSSSLISGRSRLVGETGSELSRRVEDGGSLPIICRLLI